MRTKRTGPKGSGGKRTQGKRAQGKRTQGKRAQGERAPAGRTPAGRAPGKRAATNASGGERTDAKRGGAPRDRSRRPRDAASGDGRTAKGAAGRTIDDAAREAQGGPAKPAARRPGGPSKGKPFASRGAPGRGGKRRPNTGAKARVNPAARAPSSGDGGSGDAGDVPAGERLQKYLSRSGIASRRKAEELITSGRVTVNGTRAELGMRVLPTDDVRVNGHEIERPSETVTYVLYKPTKVLTTVRDDRGRPTVMDLVPNAPGLHPVGRLDADSEGLLILTNDGELTLELTHPRYGHEKEYRLWCREGTVKHADLQRLRDGVELDDGLAVAAAARPADGGCVIVLTQGRNRQVRRMMQALGYKVVRLLRTRIGELTLGTMQPGASRRLGHEELKKLRYTP